MIRNARTIQMSSFSKSILITSIGSTGLIAIYGVIAYEETSFHYGFEFLANLLTVFALAIYVLRSVHTGFGLFWRISIIYYSLGYFNLMIEAYLFGISSLKETIQILLMGIPLCALVSMLLIWTSEKKNTADITAAKVRKWKLKILAGSLTYVIIYLIAGVVIYSLSPSIEGFYRDRLPAFSEILLVNLLLRGVVFALIGLLVFKSMRPNDAATPLVLGTLFSIIGGLAPLIPPNTLMPSMVRLGHAFEVVISNFLYGMILFYSLKSGFSGKPLKWGVLRLADLMKSALVVALLLGIFGMPGAYYFFLKIILFPSLIYLSYLAYTKNQFWQPVFYAVSLILFNPFIPFYFEKIIWLILDVALIALILFSFKAKLIKNSLVSK